MQVERWIPNQQQLEAFAEEWWKMHKPQWMLFLARERLPICPPVRKWRLAHSAFARTLLSIIGGQLPQAVLSTCDQFADGLASEVEIATARASIRQIAQPEALAYSLYTRCLKALDAAFVSTADDWPHNGMACILQVHRTHEGRVTLCNLIRDIFGNPFRPVAFDPRWRSESAVALARTAYDTRNFTLLPILADALEEAGCDHADVLNHCREPNGVHVRGCWVVDGVLGKQ
jgi:hypothetical protein